MRVCGSEKKVIGFFDFSREKFNLTQSFICGIPSGQSGIPNTSLLISPKLFCQLPPGMQVSISPRCGPIPTSINEWVFGVKKTYTYQKRFEVTLNVEKVNSAGVKVNKYFVLVTDKAFFFRQCSGVFTNLGKQGFRSANEDFLIEKPLTLKN